MLKFIDGVFYLVRGDTGSIEVNLTEPNTGQPYEMKSNDKITLTVRELPDSSSPALMTVISSTNELKILATMSQDIPYGEYSADIQVTLADGRVDTIWPTDVDNKDRRKIKNLKNFCIVSEVTISG